MGWGEILFPDKQKNNKQSIQNQEPQDAPEKYKVKTSVFVLHTGANSGFSDYEVDIKWDFTINYYWILYKYDKRFGLDQSNPPKRFTISTPTEILESWLRNGKYIKTVTGIAVNASEVISYKELSTEEEEIEL